MIALMTELKRVLKPTGTMWINLGDTYNTVSGNMKSKEYVNTINVCMNNGVIDRDVYTKPKDIPSKSLILIPHRFAIRCIDELGLILRNDIIWAKRNGMPESVTDRFSKKHEFFFFFVKQQKYYFDLDGIREKHSAATVKRVEFALKKNEVYGVNTNTKAEKTDYMPQQTYARNGRKGMHQGIDLVNGKNPGSVSDFWDIPTQPSSEKHYATFNFKLIDKPIVAGCPEGGVIFDPFCGTGTTLARAIQLGRKAIGCDGSEQYCKIAQKRIDEIKSQINLFAA